MANMQGEMCSPVFLTTRALPLINGENPDTAEICAAAEVSLGPGTMRAAQRIGGLWRLYCRQPQHRQKLCMEGFMLAGVRIMPLDSNPFLVNGSQEEAPSTKLWIGNIPIFTDNGEIEKELKILGAVLRSPIKAELARDKKGKLTNWETGRRFVFITTPSSPLPPSIKIGRFSGTLYHKEMKSAKKCTKCLMDGHKSYECQNDIVCLVCRKPGHKKGEANCTLTQSQPAATTESHLLSPPSPPIPSRPTESNSVGAHEPTQVRERPAVSSGAARSASNKRKDGRTNSDQKRQRSHSASPEALPSKETKRQARIEAFVSAARAGSDAVNTDECSKTGT